MGPLLDARRGKGQALTEVALVLPLFLGMVFGVIDIGRVIWANDVVANAAREGARYASVNAGTPGTGTDNTFPASKDDIREHVQGFMFAGGVGTTVTVCFSTVQIAAQVQGCSGDVDQADAYYERGNLVNVTVTSRVPVLTGMLLGFGEFTVSGESVVLINN